MKTIYLLDDHKLFAGGLELLFQSLPGNPVCRSFDDHVSFNSSLSVEADSPDLFVIDFYIPGCNVPDLLDQIRTDWPSSPILVVSASINPADRGEALRAGAHAFLNKSSEPETFLQAVNALLSGEAPHQENADQSSANKFNLTKRQLEILVMASKGLSNKEIARLLDISPETVKSHLRDIFQRFGVSNRIEAIDYARSYGLA